MERNYILGKRIIFDVLENKINGINQVIRLGGREASILKILYDDRNRAITKDELNKKVWGDLLVSEASLTKAISNLRKSLESLEGIGCKIKTLPKEGYMLIMDDEIEGVLWNEELPPLEVTNIEEKDMSFLYPQLTTNSGSINFQSKPSHFEMYLPIVISSLLSSLITTTALAMMLHLN